VTEQDVIRRLRLNAMLDGELDAMSAFEVERELEGDPALRAELERLEALRRALRAHAPQTPAPDALRARLIATVEQMEPARTAQARPRDGAPAAPFWPSLGAAVAATVLVTLGLERFAATERPSPVLQAVVYAHMRAQISGQPADIAASDNHVVKPWLAAKLPVDAIVVDLASQGFPLLGGRVDVIGGAGVPTLVYRRRDHLVSVSEIQGQAQSFPNAPVQLTQDGYPVFAWSDGQRGYVAVSDVAAPELRTFVEAFQRAAKAQESGPAAGRP
jgi:anti-sigma factor RsiW